MSSDPSNPKRSLSEISHLFLSSVRDRQTQGAPRPVRTPPTGTQRHATQHGGTQHSAGRDISIDLTPEEFAQVSGNLPIEDSDEPVPGPMCAILASHLNGGSFDRVREYAGHLTADGTRVGLIECDASLFRIMLFEQNPNPTGEATEELISAEGFDRRRMHEALEELSWDVDRWLVLLPSTRTHEARTLLRSINHWVLLSTCDHDGVVSSYRTLKGLADLGEHRVSLALLNATDDLEAQRVVGKLTSVSKQFLNRPMSAEPPVRKQLEVAEHLVICCRSTRDKAQLATAPQWELLNDFLRRSKAAEPAQPVTPAQDDEPFGTHSLEEELLLPTEPAVEQYKMPQPSAASSFATATYPAVSLTGVTSTPTADFNGDEVIDLPEGTGTPQSIIRAVMQARPEQWVECPVKPPMCPQATLAVTRDHQLTLLAVASEPLADLRSIGLAYQWMIENRSLIALAVPQLAIDAHQHPRLQILLGHSEQANSLFRPMLESSHVTLLTYRKLRWAGRTGLLLNAA